MEAALAVVTAFDAFVLAVLAVDSAVDAFVFAVFDYNLVIISSMA